MKIHCGIILFVLFLCECAPQRTVICFAPVKPFEPISGKELLESFNTIVPFNVNPRNFICKAKSSGLVGWVIVSTNMQKDVAKASLKESSKLKLLQVEALDSEFEKIFKLEWKHSQEVRLSNKEKR